MLWALLIQQAASLGSAGLQSHQKRSLQAFQGPTPRTGPTSVLPDPVSGEAGHKANPESEVGEINKVHLWMGYCQVTL